MSKHALFDIRSWPGWQPNKPAHSTGWTKDRRRVDYSRSNPTYTPGKHAKPSPKHHPATPVTYNQDGTTTPLFTTHRLDVTA